MICEIKDASDLRRSRRGLLTFERVFGFVLAVLALTLFTLFTVHGNLAWSIGFLYLAYDTWLLSRLIFWSRAALRNTPQILAALRPTITVLVPARNECSVLPACLDALLAQTDSAEKIWIIDDGSQDGTREMLARRYGLDRAGERVRSPLHPSLFLWSKDSTGKAHSFNQLLPECTDDLIVTIDADTVISAGSLAAVRQNFSRHADLAAGCGMLEPRCQRKWASGYFEFFQRFEYIRAFLWRLAWSRRDALVLVSGAFAFYRREVLEKLGGFDCESWVEDYELLYRLHRFAADEKLPWIVRVVPEARATTDAPGAPAQFLRQRSRWFGGFLATLFANRDMVGQPHYGGMGRVLLPVKTIDTLLPLFAALAQGSLLFLIFTRGFLSLPLLGILGGKLLFDLTLHVWALRLYSRWLDVPCGARLIAASILASVLEPFCFQPLRSTGALIGWVSFLRNRFHWESQRMPSAASDELTDLPLSEG